MRFSHRRGPFAGAVAALAAGTLLLSGCTGDATPDPADVEQDLPADIAEQLEAATTRAMQGAGATGAIVGVWAPWSGAWVEGLGTTTPGSDQAPSVDMRFRAGEITRSMTCDVLYGLVGDGVVSLGDSITEYVPSVPTLADVTLKDLCDDVSGLSGSRSLMWSSIIGNLERIWTPREFAAAGLGRSLQNAGAWNNSDTAYILLGHALENAAHRDYDELFEEYVAGPFDLEETTVPTAASAAPGENALPGLYTSWNGVRNGCHETPSDVTELSPSFGFANSDAVTTLADMRDYVAGLADEAGDVNEPAERWAGSLPTDPDGAQWMRSGGGSILMGPMIGQHGSMVGYVTAAYSDIESGLTVVVALNNSAAGAKLGGALARELSAIAAQAPAAEGEAKPEIALPWTVEQAHDQVASAAACPVD